MGAGVAQGHRRRFSRRYASGHIARLTHDRLRSIHKPIDRRGHAPISSLLLICTRLVRSPLAAARSSMAAINSSGDLPPAGRVPAAISSRYAKPTSGQAHADAPAQGPAASCTALVVLAVIGWRWLARLQARADGFRAVGGGAPLRLSPTSWSPLAISAAKRLSSACRSASTEAGGRPPCDLAHLHAVGLIDASRHTPKRPILAASRTLSKARSPWPFPAGPC